MDKAKTLINILKAQEELRKIKQDTPETTAIIMTINLLLNYLSLQVREW